MTKTRHPEVDSLVRERRERLRGMLACDEDPDGLAERAGLSPSTLRRFARGETDALSLESLLKLSNVLTKE